MDVNGNNKSLLRQKYLTKMLLGEAVMLFHRKIRRSKKYRVLTDTDPLVSHNLQGLERPDLPKKVNSFLCVKLAT